MCLHPLIFTLGGAGGMDGAMDRGNWPLIPVHMHSSFSGETFRTRGGIIIKSGQVTRCVLVWRCFDILRNGRVPVVKPPLGCVRRGSGRTVTGYRAIGERAHKSVGSRLPRCVCYRN